MSCIAKKGKKYKRVKQGNLNDFEFNKFKGMEVTVTKIEEQLWSGKTYVYFTPSMYGYTQYTRDYFEDIFSEVKQTNKIGGKLC